jgi:Mg2+/Co2+ transporter CorB
LTHSQTVLLSIVLVVLILLSGFFSMAETALMSVNRYRLRHKARMKKNYASLILRLLKRPDRLLGMILIGNNISNIVASAIVTLLAASIWGEASVIISTAVLTVVVLIFSEVAPKTFAVLHPDRVSRAVVYPIYYLLKIFSPFVWMINMIANGILRIFNVQVGNKQLEPLSREELRSVVYDTTGKMSRQYQNMLLGILDLNKVRVDDVMIPSHQIIGVDIDMPWEAIKKQLTGCTHDWLPVYRENMNQLLGLIQLRQMAGILISGKELDKELMLKKLNEPYYVPEGTPLHTQLLHFQRLRKRLAFVVDEYGEIRGLVTLEDILEEIVGEFTTNVASTNRVEEQKDGSFLVDGAVTLRELNRVTKFRFPVRGPRTLNGLIIEYLEALPHPGTCVRISGYPIEIIHVKENLVDVAQIFPKETDET